MIDVRVRDVQSHPDQATNNPGCWAVRFEVSYNGTKRSFWLHGFSFNKEDP